MLTKLLSNAIVTWATRYPAILRVWLYGSRVKGTARPDSDLDVAVEIHSHEFRGQAPYLWWMFESKAMKASLSEVLSPVKLDMQQYEQSALEVLTGVADHGILLYGPPIQEPGVKAIAET